MADNEKMDFESSLAELESLVKTMEEGKMTLEESLAAYERGITLTKHCQSVLEDAKRRITEIQNSETPGDDPRL